MKAAEKSAPYIKNYQIAAYDEHREKLEEWRKQNEAAAFDYADKDGLKEVKSYLYKLRQFKASIDKTRKAEKESVLEQGRLIDSEAKELIADVEALIAVHQGPLDEMEAQEEARVEAIKGRIAAIEGYANIAMSCKASGDLENFIKQLNAIDTANDGFDEFAMIAEKARRHALEMLTVARGQALERELEQAELDRLRKESAERETKEREERIAKEAAQMALKSAEEALKREREFTEQKARDERAAAERQANELKLAAERAEREKAEAVERERKRAQGEKEAQEAADKKREENIKHQVKIHADIIKAMEPLGISEPAAKAIIVAIRNGEVPHLKIVY